MTRLVSIILTIELIALLLLGKPERTIAFPVEPVKKPSIWRQYKPDDGNWQALKTNSEYEVFESEIWQRGQCRVNRFLRKRP